MINGTIMANINELYANYKKTSDEEIRKTLATIKLVVLTDRGLDSKKGYYSITSEQFEKVRAKPRGVSFPFDPKIGDYESKITQSTKKEKISFLVKSSSRFFLKPDIGEVIDQMTDEQKGKVIAICIEDGSECVNSDGDHFLMEATLFYG